MKHIIFLYFIYLTSICIGNAQDSIQQEFSNNGEIYFQFVTKNQNEIEWLSKFISIDDYQDGIISAYANKKEFNVFLKLGKDFKILSNPNEGFNPKMLSLDEVKNINAWDAYPTYEAYVSMMYQFEADYPNICDVFSIGQSEEGRELLVAKISDNINTHEDEPEFLYTSSMHGDEITGYVLMLRLIDSLLVSYDNDPRITSLVNGIEIYINPLANPDGTYSLGNSTVSGATRNNANNVNLNRNYPDPDDGPHPDGNVYQSETIHFMNFAENHHFVLSANMHGGTEVVNYPWDTWSFLTADDSWWQYVSHEYADTAQAFSPFNYMNAYNDGITNGYAWYTITGGRQDYMNYFLQCREVTIELSDVKLIPENQLNAHWEYNKRSLLNYIEQSLYGIRGIITDANTGSPIEAEVLVLNHDQDSSWVYSNLPIGNYHRLIHAGTYSIRCSAPGYFADTIFNINVANYSTTIQDVQLVPVGLMAEFSANNTHLGPGGSVDFMDLSFGNPISWQWTFEGGTPSTSTQQNPSGISFNNPGNYSVTLEVSNGLETDIMVKTDYITVANDYVMSNITISACSGNFYDSGGNDQFYLNDEDLSMTFLPTSINGKIKVDFSEFDLEYQSACSYDWLQVFDGPDISATLIGTYCGTNSPGMMISTHSTGALTFVFHSDYSVTRPGWKAAITCEIEPITLNIKVYLEGPFEGTVMQNLLNMQNRIPITQPYNILPWNYSGTESVIALPNANIIDWVLVELRDAPNAAAATPATRLARSAAFILNDGSITDVDGFSNLSFDYPINQSIFVIIYHRNHLGVMSAHPLTTIGNVYSFDFTNPTGQAFGTDAQKNIAGNLFAMYAGDANADNTIELLDKSDSWLNETGIGGYLSSDLNLDGESNNLDKNEFWLINQGQTGSIPE